MALSPGFAGHAGLALAQAPAEARDEGAVHVWVHAAGAAAHDFHTGVPGSFAAAVADIARARAAGVGVSTLLTRSNARVLQLLPAWLHAHGVSAWRVAVPRVVGAVRRAASPVQVTGVGALDGLLPRLSVAVPHVLQALSLAEKLGLAAGIGGAPLCLLGPFAGVAVPEPPRAFAPVCSQCPARARCPGVDDGYLRRFAGDELSPRGLREPAGAGPPAWMFPGPGTLEQVRSDMSVGTGRTVRLAVLTEGRDDR